MATMERTEEQARVRKVGLIVLGVFAALALLAICGGGGIIGYFGYNSESAGVSAMYVGALPIGFCLSGFLGAAAGHFLVKDSAKLKVAIPVVAGGVGGPCFLLAIWLFFVVIFPAL